MASKNNSNSMNLSGPSEGPLSGSTRYIKAFESSGSTDISWNPSKSGSLSRQSGRQTTYVGSERGCSLTSAIGILKDNGPIMGQWEDFLRHLDISGGTIVNLRAKHLGDVFKCLDGGVREWHSRSSDHGIERLAYVVREFGYDRVADNIEDQVLGRSVEYTSSEMTRRSFKN